MAKLDGKGPFEGVSLIVRCPARGSIQGKNGKSGFHFLEIQIDQSLVDPGKVKTGEVQAQTNPYLTSYKAVHSKTGQEYVSHRAKYWDSQFDKIKDAAKDNIVTLDNGDVLVGIQGTLVRNAHGNMSIKTDAPMGPTQNPHFGADILEQQSAVTMAAKAYRDAQLPAKTTAIEKSVEAMAENASPELES